MSSLRRASERSRGFTLLELMIAVAIVAIIATIAYSSFMRQVAKSRRTDAKAALLSCAQMLERFNTQSGSYAAGADAAVNTACVGTTTHGYYQMPTGNIPGSAGAGTFLIAATPIGAQAADPCGSFTYTQDGNKGVVGATMTTSDCW